MARARAWVGLGLCALLLLPVGGAAAIALPTLPTADPPGLPVPAVSHPRLGFVDRSSLLREATLSAEVDGPGDHTWVAGTRVSSQDLATGRRQDGEGSSWVSPERRPRVAWVSTVDAAGPDDAGDVYVSVLPEPAAELPTDQRVTCDPARESHPVLSPDGTLVAFATDARGDWDVAIAPVPTEGEGCRASAGFTFLTGPGSQDTWPTWLDDERIVYAGARDGGQPDLFGVTADATPIAQLTATPGISETQPAAQVISGGWRLVFTTTQFRADGSLALLVMGGPDLLPATVVDPYASSCCRPQGSEGSWSPAGSSVAFTSTQDDPAGDVWVTRWVTQDGARTFRVLGQAAVIATFGVSESHATWVDDDVTGGEGGWDASARIVFTEEVPSTDVSDVVADDGSDPRLIESLGTTWDAERLAEAGIEYSPDGTRVAYSAPVPPDIGEEDEPVILAAALVPTYGQRVVIADATTLDVVGPTYVPDDEDDVDLDPTWSPDGSTIAFVRWHYWGDGYTLPRIFTLDVGSGAVTQLTVGLGTDDWAVDPSWSPDGTRVVYATGTGDDEVPSGASYLAVVDVRTGVSSRLRVTYPRCDYYGGDCVFDVQGRSPDWSPDGTQVAAADLVAMPRWFAGGYYGPPDFRDPRRLEVPGGIGIVDLSSPGGLEVVRARALTGVADDGTATPTVAQVAHAADPEWSPDGSHVAFSAVPVGLPWERRGIAEVAAVDGSGLRLVADPPGVQREPGYQPWTDLVLTLATSVVGGDGSATVTAAATNAGPGWAARPTVTVRLPLGLSTPGVAGCLVGGQVLTCVATTQLAPGGTATFDLPVLGVTQAAVSTVDAVAITASPERVVTNNTATIDVGVPGGVSVDVTLSAPPVAWVGGLPVSATFTVRNGGSAPSEGVTLTTTYPGTVTPSGLAPCAAPTGTCALGTLPGLGAVVLTAVLTPDVVFEGPPQLGDVTATVSTTSPDPAPADNSARAALEVRRPHVDLQPAVARPGEVVFLAGTDFPPGADVNLSWSLGIMGIQNPLTAGPDGRWALAVPLIRDSLVVQRLLQARNGQVPPLYGDVTAPLLVVPTSIDAPTFLFRK
ncbi:hypothetical protein HP550_05820 [Cellulomonas humilata]|uniref:DUF11 domain-containing protein n=1 Tax=Cellulomonas humilata TaxID=144055 RepID=A0A7Y6DWY2_9CELL|nr:hypothetical protein [Cellulomonas humilata]